MKSMKTFLAVVGLALATQSVAADFKLGYVKIERIYSEATPAIAIQKKLEAEFADRRAELKRMEARGKELQALLAGTTLNGADRKNDERELDSLDRDYRAKVREMAEDFNQRRNEEFATLLDKANRVLKVIAERGQFDLILQDAVYVSPKYDLTDQVLKELDKQ
ncbi:OmpH family outer membrane protein [Paludibacterium yongneupense]|uniref:OmpH family outer membrane protein n=1 Tax=Paludibacterium yongneupense TaxID=400061 RepID=UPI0004021614|nr:OmpH family outer membrane protein [Paludibacterium yongneupense]